MIGSQRGATLVELCLVLLAFVVFLFALADLSRLLFIWNAAAEATRLGARYAVVCDDSTRQSAVLGRMQSVLPDIIAVDVAWQPAGCTAATCAGVRVRVTELDFKWLMPIPSALVQDWKVADINDFSTYLPRETMRQDINSPKICI